MTVEVEERLKNVEHLGHLSEDECTMWLGLHPPQQHVQCLQLPYVAAADVTFTSMLTSLYRNRQILPHPLMSDQTIPHSLLWCDSVFILRNSTSSVCSFPTSQRTWHSLLCTRHVTGTDKSYHTHLCLTRQFSTVSCKVTRSASELSLSICLFTDSCQKRKTYLFEQLRAHLERHHCVLWKRMHYCCCCLLYTFSSKDPRSLNKV